MQQQQPDIENTRYVINNSRNIYGYINSQGDIVIYPQYSVATNFCEGLANVKRNYKYGYIDINGNIVIDFLFNSASEFHNGYASVTRAINQNTYGCGVINKKGEYIIEPTFLEIDEFSEGLASASRDRQLFGYINEKGAFVIPELYTYAYGFSEGLALVSYDGRRAGFIDRTGDVKIPLIFSDARHFSNGFAAVQEHLGKGNWGFINKVGDYFIEPKYLEVGSFYNGMAWGLDRNGNLHFFDTRADIQFTVPGFAAGGFSEGFCAIKRGSLYGRGIWGYIDESGDVAIDFQFDVAAPFENGIARISQKGFIGYINKKGEFIWKPNSLL